MNPTIKKMWSQGITLATWAKNNGFNADYCRHVIAGRSKVVWGVGTGAKIVRALKLDGFWVEPPDLKKSA